MSSRRRKRRPVPEDDTAARVFSLNDLLPEPASLNAPMVSFVERVSERGHRVQVESTSVVPPSPIKRARLATSSNPRQAVPADTDPLRMQSDFNQDRYEIGTDHNFPWLPEPQDDVGDEPMPASHGTSGARVTPAVSLQM